MIEVGKDKVVLISQIAPGEAVCVDVFRRADGSYGFELYRRDFETTEGWFVIGFHSEKRYETLEDATSAAGEEFDWFQMP